MADECGKRSGAEEYVDTEIELSQPLTAEQEKSLRESLQKIDPCAFESCDVGTERISFAYDPTRTNKHALLDAIKRAGGQLKHVESEGSPLL